MGLEKLVIKQITGAAGNAFKMDIVVDAMKDKVIDEVAGKIEESIPVPLPFDTRSVIGGNVPLPADLLTPEVIQTVPEISESQRAELLTVLDNLETQLNGLIDTKNKLQGALDTLRSPITTLEKLADTLGKVIPKLKGAVTIIRNLPLPTAVPPGVGLPATVLNNFSNSLDVLKVVIDKIDGPVSVVSDGVKEIVKVITPILGKLKLLDPLFSQSQQIIIFLRTLLLYGPNATQQDINGVASDVSGRSTAILDSSPGPLNSSSTGEWRMILPLDGTGGEPPIGVPPTPPSPFTDGRGNVYEFFSDDKAYSDFLLGLLTPPVVGNGLIYRGYQLTIENDPSNNFPFPSRRIVANFNLTLADINSNDPDTNFALRLLGSVLYNLPDEDYSFSSSVQVLISEAYYEIDRFVEGKQSIQNLINNEYIYDSNGVAIGRIPGRSGFTLPWVSNTNSGVNTVSSANSSLASSTISPFEGGPAIDAVNNAGNRRTSDSSRFPRIFQTYIDRFPNANYSQVVQGFNIVIESGINTIIGGQFNLSKATAPASRVASAATLSPRTSTGSSNGAGSNPPPPQTNPYFPFNSKGTPNELRLYNVPNTNPLVIKTFKWNGSKWNLIATSGGTSGGKGGGGGSSGGIGRGY